MVILNKKILKLALVIFAAVLGVYFLTNTIIFKMEENLLDAKIMKNQIGLYMWVGFGLPNQGQYSNERYGEYYDYLEENNYDYAKASKYFQKKLKNEIKENYGKYPNLIKTKTIINFKEDDGQLGFLSYSIKENSANIKDLLLTLVKDVNNIYYIIILLFTLLGCIYNIKYLKNNSLLFINITFFGGCLMLLFAEAQNRYKYALLPLLCIIAAIGLYYGYDLIKKIGKERK